MKSYGKKIFEAATLTNLVRPEYHAFFDSAYVPICSFTLFKNRSSKFKGAFIDLQQFYGAEIQSVRAVEAINNHECGWFFRASAADFKKIPGSPIAYWVSKILFATFKIFPSLSPVCKPTQGLATGDNDTFVRVWHEVSNNRTGFHFENRKQAKESKCKWFPYNKGGDFRRWYGNQSFVINWKNDGEELFSLTPKSVIRNPDTYFQKCISWSKISSGLPAFRYFPKGFIYDVAGTSIFANDSALLRRTLGFCNSLVTRKILEVLSPTLNFEVGHIKSLPLNENAGSMSIIENLIRLSKNDWNAHQTSWDFATLPFLQPDHHQPTLKATYAHLRAHWHEMTLEMQRLEEENNRIFIEAYGLQDELTPDVPLSEITLTCNPHYRYNGNKNEAELETLLLGDTIRELISYAVGCMMGRYSLDEPGLIYANSGNLGFDPSRYKTFPADDDGIIPIMDQDWFSDDAANRFVEFLKVTWPPETLDDNLHFVASCLKPKRNEPTIDTIRRYLSTGFFKDHLKTYKKRPIYWLFSSGRQKAFECLVYLHRYNESTLSRMRSTYVTPLQGNFSARLEFLQNEKEAASTASAQKKFQKEIDALKKKQAELSKFDDALRHYADMKIALDLDDGVKVNYGKFGDLLAEKKTITGKK